MNQPNQAKTNGKEQQAPVVQAPAPEPKIEPTEGAALQKRVEEVLSEGKSICVRGATLALAIYEANEAKRSLEYILEEAVINGIKAMKRSREYTEDTRNQREFSKALTNDPTIASDITRLHACMRKYKLPVPLTASEK